MRTDGTFTAPRGQEGWRDSPRRALDVDYPLKLTAPDLVRLGVRDEIVKEGAGGAHRDLSTTAENLRQALRRHLDQACALSPSELLARRYEKYRAMGVIEEART